MINNALINSNYSGLFQKNTFEIHKYDVWCYTIVCVCKYAGEVWLVYQRKYFLYCIVNDCYLFLFHLH